MNSNCQPSEKDLLPADQPLAKGLYKMLLFILSQGSYQHLPVLHSIQILQRQLQVLPVSDKTVQYGYCCHVDLFHKGMLLPLRVITTPASFAFATIAFAHPSSASKEMKYPPRGADPGSDLKSAKFSFKNFKNSLKLRTQDICMFLHMFYNSVNIFEETYMTQLIYLIMSDRLHTSLCF